MYSMRTLHDIDQAARKSDFDALLAMIEGAYRPHYRLGDEIDDRNAIDRITQIVRRMEAHLPPDLRPYLAISLTPAEHRRYRYASQRYADNYFHRIDPLFVGRGDAIFGIPITVRE